MKRLLDVLWLLLLGVYVFALSPTFHGDEAMQIYMSRDYATAFIDHNPAALITAPPYGIDTDAYLRLINGSVNRYAIGLSWQIAGLGRSDLPPRPGWDWGLDYQTNVDTGHLLSAAMLQVARFSSTFFLALSVTVMFALGWQYGTSQTRRPLAYFVSALYVVNPVILLNGRRALQEGSTLFFGLSTILIAVLISKRLQSHEGEPKTRTTLVLWLSLILAGGLTLASKYTGIVFVGAALGWVFLAEAVRLNLRALLLTTGRLIICGLLILLLFIGLSPALWSDPPARLVDSLQQRAQLLQIQVGGDLAGGMSLAERLREIVVQPFMTAPQHFEVDFWSTFQAVTDDVNRYMASPFSGLQFGLVLGGLLTLFAGVGIILSFRRDWRIGVLGWLVLTVASLLANPLPWQRYYLGLIPLATLLLGITVEALLRRFVWKPEQAHELSHTPS
ncbi:MAG: hypothetical protein GC204_02700 [Chloroflexi bacterium]|nr:hypothetical protein [Chloroflexota bacterium]